MNHQRSPSMALRVKEKGNVQEDIWASTSEWKRRGYAVVAQAPSIQRAYRTPNGWVTYDAYHAYHARLSPEIWSRVVGRLSRKWHHLRRQEPDQATASVVHDLLLENGQEEAAGRLRWVVLGTEERFRTDLAAHEAMVRAEEEKVKAEEEARKKREPSLRRRWARWLAREAARWTEEGIKVECCLIPVGLDWQDRPALLAYLRDRGKTSLAEQLAGVNAEELCVRPCLTRRNRLELCRIVREYRGFSSEELREIAASKRPVPDEIVELLLGAAGE